uniref:Nucleolar and coiled-body phosphoprotein 1 n=1 Tax=Sphenodon punctatus TaxID=8508 RepID=A0A8D0HEQ2_SPHPU
MAERSVVPSDLFPLVLTFLRENRFEGAARAFRKAAGVVRNKGSRGARRDGGSWDRGRGVGRGTPSWNRDCSCLFSKGLLSLELFVKTFPLDSDSSEDKAPTKSKVKPTPPATKKPPSVAKKADSSSDSSSEEEKKALPAKPAGKTTNVGSKPNKTPKASSSDSDSSSSEEEQSKPPMKSVNKSLAGTRMASGKKAAAASSSSSSEEEPKAAGTSSKVTPAKGAKNGTSLEKKKSKALSTPAAKSPAAKKPESSRAGDSKNSSSESSTDEKGKANGGKFLLSRKVSAASPFRRVREEEIEVDARVSNNSFDAKRGAEGDWGEKAHNILKFTKGKSFRHEKTKKKRGSYCGGAISTQVNSIKFESD